MNNRVSTPVAIAILGLLAICVVSATELVVLGRSPDTVLSFMGTVIVPTVTVLFLGKRVDQVGDNVEAAKQTAVDNNNKLDNVQKAVNGNLDAKFRDLERKLMARLSEPDSKS